MFSNVLDSEVDSPLRKANGNALAEFPIALFVLLFLALFPVIDLVWLGLGYSTSILIAHQAVTRASEQSQYEQALVAMRGEAIADASSGLGALLGLQPVNGFDGCGLNLFIHATDVRAGTTSTTGPNVGLSVPPDALTNVYEYTAVSDFRVRPLINLNSIPFIGSVPGLGVAAEISSQATRAIEHLPGLYKAGTAVGFTSVSNRGPYPGRNDTQVGGDPPQDGVGWNYPNIYQLIAQKGQTVVSEDVFLVPADQEGWTMSSCYVQPGMHVWIDSHAEGIWNAAPDGISSNLTADGMSADYVGPYGLITGSLVSQVGGSGPVYQSGKSLLDYAPQSSGNVMFMMNDGPGWFWDNSGEQIVRVIVTKAG